MDPIRMSKIPLRCQWWPRGCRVTARTWLGLTIHHRNCRYGKIDWRPRNEYE